MVMQAVEVVRAGGVDPAAHHRVAGRSVHLDRRLRAERVPLRLDDGERLQHRIVHVPVPRLAIVCVEDLGDAVVPSLVRPLDAIVAAILACAKQAQGAVDILRGLRRQLEMMYRRRHGRAVECVGDPGRPVTLECAAARTCLRANYSGLHPRVRIAYTSGALPVRSNCMTQERDCSLVGCHSGTEQDLIGMSATVPSISIRTITRAYRWRCVDPEATNVRQADLVIARARKEWVK